MSRVIACTVGSLMGDAWMRLPALVKLSQEHEVSVASGSYALSVWTWGKKYLKQANYEIISTTDDPDIVTHPFCPGKGYPAINAALAHVKSLYPGATVLGDLDIGSFYYKQTLAQPYLELTGLSVTEGAHVAVHSYTRHEWKNCGGVVAEVKYQRPALPVGLQGEPTLPGRTMGEKSFNNMVAEVLQSYGFVGVLSSWFNLATLFRKRLVVASFTEDVPTDNPNATVLVRPSKEELQAAVTGGGF